MNYRITAFNDNGDQLGYALEGGRNPHEALVKASEKVAREIHDKIEKNEICLECENTGYIWSGKYDDGEQIPCTSCRNPEEERSEHQLEMNQGN